MVVSEALPLAVPISETLDITKESSPVEQQQQQQQTLLDVQERPRAPVDPGVEAGNAEEAAGIGAQEAAAVTQDAGTGAQEAKAATQLHGSCQDLEEGCVEWAAEDGCIQNGPSFMFERCRKSCGVCDQPIITDVPENVTLNNGVVMPRVGFGTAGLGGATEEATSWALASGYRLLDSAQAQEWYREDLVGQALLKSGVPREQVFLTSKLHPRHHGRDEAMIQFTKSLSALAVEQVDLFLLHYPACWPELCGEGYTPKGTWHDSWRALEELVDKGLVRAIGVSNFGLDDLAELLAMARIKPALVQRHSDPLAADAEVRAFCRLADVQYQGYSTLGSQWLAHGMDKNPVLTNAVVERVANETGGDAAQVVLRWALQHGQAIVPRSSKRERIAANRGLDFVLTANQMQRIDALDGSLQHN
ncbi:hypothetical protein WJX75_002791 [Coccomyxa subellipsoidea]|uniref:ShKT domain-containing protein n=1 Tax=Coccomyxa subellipsoidea TaxID=248742 RepID=A0ABR2YAV3_9CHLO